MDTGKTQEEKDLEAVKNDGMALEYVKEQTPEICLAAVNQNWRAFKYVKIRTSVECIAAARQQRTYLELFNEENLGRPIIVCEEYTECLRCGKLEDCISFDSSDHEYTDVCFCVDCLKGFIKEHQKN